jgi:hypothetical protein
MPDEHRRQEQLKTHMDRNGMQMLCVLTICRPCCESVGLTLPVVFESGPDVVGPTGPRKKENPG